MNTLPILSGYTFPNDNVPDSEKKTTKWGLEVARGFWSMYCSGNTYGWGYSNQSDLLLVRSYGDGNQPEEICKKQYLNESPIGQKHGKENSRDSRLRGMGSRIALNNISFRVYNPMAKFSSVVCSVLAGSGYYVDATSLTQDSVDKKTKKKLKALYRTTITNPLLNQIGLPEVPSHFQPTTEEELDMMERRGMFKLDIERSLEKIIESGFKISDYKGEIEPKVHKDATDFSILASRIYTCPETGMVKIRYVDDTKLITLWNDTDVEPSATGDWRWVDIQDIYHDLKKCGYSDSQIQSMARNYGTSVGSAYPVNAQFERRDILTDRWRWMGMKVPVLDFVYLSTSHKQFVKGKDKKGKNFYHENEIPLPDNKKDKTKEYDDFEGNFWWEGSYIVGTDVLFNWRKIPHQIYRSPLNPTSPYVIHKAVMSGLPLTQRVIGTCDDLQMAVLKRRAAVFRAAPKGFDIDITESGNIKIGGEEYSAFDVLHMYLQNGIMFRASRYNQQSGKVTLSPIQERENGLGKQGQEWIMMIGQCLYEIANNLGITDAMAAQPDTTGEKLVGVMEMEVESSTHALYPLKQASIQFQKKLAEKIALQARINIKYDKKAKENYEIQLGKHIVDVLETIEDLDLTKLGIILKPKPNQKEKDLIMQRAVEMSMMTTRSGNTLLDPADVTQIGRLLENDDPEAAEYFMTQRVDFHRKDGERQAKEAAEQTFQGQQQTAIVVEQEKRKTMEFQNQLDLAKIAAEERKEINVLNAKYQFETPSKIEQIVAKSEGTQKEILVEASAEAAYNVEVTGKV